MLLKKLLTLLAISFLSPAFAQHTDVRPGERKLNSHVFEVLNTTKDDISYRYRFVTEDGAAGEWNTVRSPGISETTHSIEFYRKQKSVTVEVEYFDGKKDIGRKVLRSGDSIVFERDKGRRIKAERFSEKIK
jgi:hypothetical protein